MSNKTLEINRLIGNVNNNNEIKLKYVTSEFYTGGTPKFTDDNNSIPWIDDLGNDTNIKKVTKEALTKKKLKVVEKNSVLYSINNELGKVDIANTDVAISKSVLSFSGNKNYDNNYLKHLLSLYEDNIDYYTDGNDHIEVDTVKEFPVPSISKDEQIKMANYIDEKLETIDKIIKLHEQSIEKLKLSKKSLIHNVITGKIDVK